MTKKTRLNCYAVQTWKDNLKTWEGRCKQFPDLVYYSRGYEGALSGVRRLAKKRLAASGVNTPSTVRQDKKLRNRVAIVLDRSGSMQVVRASAIRAFNDVLAELRRSARSTGQETTLTLVSFASSVVTDRSGEPIDLTPDLSMDSYRPIGNTALYDAVGHAIERLSAMPGSDDLDTSMLVIVVTDGEENYSMKHSVFTLSELLRKVNATDRWTVAWQVPRGYKQKLVKLLDLPEGNVTEWEISDRGAMQSAAQNVASINSFYVSRSVGMRSSKDFYTTDLSNLTKGQVTRTLDNIAPQVRVLTVEKEQELRPFVEGKTKQSLLRGAAFYQLTKPEKEVQDYKKLLLVEKGNPSKVYAGDDARSLLGLPTKGTVKVVPGNHAGWDVFVQSTSTNRKLVRGTKVVYWPAVGVPYLEGPSSKGRGASTSRARRK